MALSKFVIDLLPFVEDCEVEEVLIIFCSDNKNGVIPRVKEFELNCLVDEFCFLHFRFYKADILRLKRGLRLEGSIVCKNGVRVGALEALCITLRRLAYPNRLVDLMKLFPRTRCEISRIFNVVTRRLIASHSDLLTLKHPYLTVQKIEELVDAIVDKGSPYAKCFGFVDGTVRAMCRPTINQRKYYNGHKRVHALKFQSVMLPDGIIGSCLSFSSPPHGPFQRS